MGSSPHCNKRVKKQSNAQSLKVAALADIFAKAGSKNANKVYSSLRSICPSTMTKRRNLRNTAELSDVANDVV